MCRVCRKTNCHAGSTTKAMRDLERGQTPGMIDALVCAVLREQPPTEIITGLD